MRRTFCFTGSANRNIFHGNSLALYSSYSTSHSLLLRSSLQSYQSIRYFSYKIPSPTDFDKNSNQNNLNNPNNQNNPDNPDKEPKKSLWNKIKHEASHYWDGSKKLAKNVKVSSQLAKRMIQKNGTLNWREERLLSGMNKLFQSH